MADQVLVRPDDTSGVPGYVGGMVIDGVAASEALDSSGEILDVEGADISDLQNGLGVLNWEHENGAKDVIGKIIYARKIFEKEDCEDDRQREYWDQLELPFIYHQARLYDGAGHEAARAVAAMIRDHAANGEPILVRFSIEGSTLEKDPKDPRRLAATVARRVAATIKPCNRSCHSGLVRDPNGSIAMAKSETGDLKPLAKTLTAGSVGGAPEALTGLAALQPEHLGKKWVAVSMGALRDYRDYPWDRAEFGRVLKHLLPEAPQEYFDSFMDVAEKIRLPKQLLKKSLFEKMALDDLKPGTRVDGGWDYSHLLKPQDKTDDYSLHLFVDGDKHDPLGYGVSIRHRGREVGLVYGHRYTDTVTPSSHLEEPHRGRGLARAAYEALIAHARQDGVEVMAGEAGRHSSKIHLRLQQLHGLEPGRSSGGYHHYRYQLNKNDSEVPKTTSVASEQPMTIRGQPVSPNRHLTRPTFDEHAGILHTPKGSFPMYIPGREDDPQVFIKALSDPQVEDFHGRAVENWARMRDALRNGKTAPEVVMHATLFSQLSPQTPVPVQELQYCLGEDTILHTTEGVCKKIKNFLPGDTVFSFDSDGRVVRTQVVALHDHGDVDAYLVEFDDGYEVVCSINHKFLTRFGQLPIGEIISSGLEVCCAQKDERRGLADSLRKELRERTSEEGTPQELSGVPGSLATSSFSQRETIYEGSCRTEQAEGRCSRVEREASGQEARYVWDREVAQGESGVVCREPTACSTGDVELARKESGISSDPCAEDPDYLQGVARQKSHSLHGKCAPFESSRYEMEGGTPRRSTPYLEEASSSVRSDLDLSDGRGTRARIICCGVGQGDSDLVWRGEEEGGLRKSGQEIVGGGRWPVAFLRGESPRCSDLSTKSRCDVEPGSSGSGRCNVNQALDGVLLLSKTCAQGVVERAVGEVLGRTPARGLVFRKAVRVCFVGIRRMYDLEVAHREHNFLLPNGIVTSNSHLVDMMRETGIDARDPDFTSLKDNWLSRDRPDRGPTHESQYFEQLQGAKSWGKGGARPPGSFQKFPLSSGKWDSMANYHRMHQGLTDLVNRHRTDGRSATRELMENKVKFGAHQRRKGQVEPFPGIPVNGLAPKTARYLFGMLGAENVVVPDTHVSRHLFGLDKDKDSATIDYVKRVLWDEKNTPVLEGIDRYYAKHHPAVRFLREHPKYGSLFSEDEQALFPAFWRHWLAIPPDERARGMKSQAFNAETDHTPFWRAVDPYVAKSEESTRWRLPAETAAQHDRWVREHGEVPALMLYYQYLAPKLMGMSELGKAIGEAARLGKSEDERVVVHNKRALPPDVHARAEEAYNRHAAESRGYDYRPNINKRMRVHLIGYSPHYNEDTFEFEHEPLGGTMGVRPPLYEGDNRNRPFITWPAPNGAEEWRGEHHTKVPSDMAWRGMDWEGWQNAVRAGHIKSLGNYNLDGQEGLTCWSPSVDTAINYSSGFAPFQHAAGHHVPGVVIGVPRSKVMGPGEHPGIPSSELGHVGEMPISAVTHAFLVHPKSAAPHTQELRVGSDSDLHHDYEKFSTARWNRGAKTSRRVYEGSGGGGGGNAHYVTPFSVNTELRKGHFDKLLTDKGRAMGVDPISPAQAVHGHDSFFHEPTCSDASCVGCNDGIAGKTHGRSGMGHQADCGDLNCGGACTSGQSRQGNFGKVREWSGGPFLSAKLDDKYEINYGFKDEFLNSVSAREPGFEDRS